MEKIKIGNSFNVMYSCLYDADGLLSLIDFTGVTNLDVQIVKNGQVSGLRPEFTVNSTQLQIPVSISAPSGVPLASLTGTYRVVISFLFNGKEVVRNPKAFMLVANVEDEGIDCCAGGDMCKDGIVEVIDRLYLKTVFQEVEQQQADWLQENTAAPDYIKNKPDIDGMIADEASARQTAIEDEATARQEADTLMQETIDALSARGNIEGEVDTHADLLALDTTGFLPNTLYIVEEDETQGGVTTMWSWDGTQWVYAGKFNVNTNASLITFDPTGTGLVSTNVQDVIKELNNKRVIKAVTELPEVGDPKVLYALRDVVDGVLVENESTLYWWDERAAISGGWVSTGSPKSIEYIPMLPETGEEGVLYLEYIQNNYSFRKIDGYKPYVWAQTEIRGGYGFIPVTTTGLRSGFSQYTLNSTTSETDMEYAIHGESGLIRSYAYDLSNMQTGEVLTGDIPNISLKVTGGGNYMNRTETPISVKVTRSGYAGWLLTVYFEWGSIGQ